MGKKSQRDFHPTFFESPFFVSFKQQTQQNRMLKNDTPTRLKGVESLEASAEQSSRIGILQLLKLSTFKHLVTIQSLKEKNFLLTLLSSGCIKHPEQMSTR